MRRRHLLSRREFAVAAAGMAGVAVAVPVVARMAPSILAQTATEGQAGVSAVALVRTNDRAEGTRRAIDLLAPSWLAGKSVFVKPNFNSADPAPGSTHADVLRALLGRLRDLGAAAVTVGDRAGMGDTRSIMQSKGVFAMAGEMGFQALVLDEQPREGWTQLNPAGSHWRSGFYMAAPALGADMVVQACCLKTHRFGGHFTMSLKNTVGLVAKWVPGLDYNFMDELHHSPFQRLMIAEANAAYRTGLVVMDGVEAFVSGGPEAGRRATAGVILASADRVAMDAVGVAILRQLGTTREVAEGPIWGLEQIRRAVELGVGAASPAQVRLITGDPESEALAASVRGILARG